MVLCIGENDNFPRFGLIKSIYSLNDRLFFVYKELITILHEQYCAYKVLNVVEDHNAIAYEDLFSSRPTGLLEKNSVSYILVRSNL